jgi:hypothetical protein
MLSKSYTPNTIGKQLCNEQQNTHPCAAVLQQARWRVVEDGYALGQALQQAQVATWQEHVAALVLVLVIKVPVLRTTIHECDGS